MLGLVRSKHRGAVQREQSQPLTESVLDYVLSHLCFALPLSRNSMGKLPAMSCSFRIVLVSPGFFSLLDFC